jgi:hypothetical protein
MDHFLYIFLHKKLSSHLCLGVTSDLFSSAFPTKILYAFLISPIYATCSALFILVWSS